MEASQIREARLDGFLRKGFVGKKVSFLKDFPVFVAIQMYLMCLMWYCIQLKRRLWVSEAMFMYLGSELIYG